MEAGVAALSKTENELKELREGKRLRPGQIEKQIQQAGFLLAHVSIWEYRSKDWIGRRFV